MRWTLVLPEGLHAELLGHLFPGDGDEHGAVIAAGVAQGEDNRLLARNLFVARDGIDYVPGQRGYRMLTAAFIREQIVFCRDEHLAYLAVHCHGGTTRVGFSEDDMASHERGYPALGQISRGQIVGGLVFARAAVAGDLWLPDGSRVELGRAVVVGNRRLVFYPEPPPAAARRDAAYDRQARLFGDRGQAVMRELKVGVIGAGGGGSLVNQSLAHLGVGRTVVVDPERFDLTNHPRVAGSRRSDAGGRWPWQRRATLKVTIAERVAREANPGGTFVGLAANVADAAAAAALTDCDYLFLAADSAQARLVFNALVHQYLIPGVQVGAKVPVDPDTGAVGDVFTAVRFVEPGVGCLYCNGLISARALQEEAMTADERRAQRYVDEPEVPAPSVISLNAIPAAHAVNDFLFNVLDLKTAPSSWLRFSPRRNDVRFDEPRKDMECPECSNGRGRLGRGDNVPLPVRLARPAKSGRGQGSAK